ncbi:MAG: LysM peptidoglycan-binding domain-containing protein [Anaerolineae bacterium]|nr:LysM peptidoglycan-binding domain-containing protein [Anaerolineae bacterium]MCB9132817.1 LysM peptidoglycan-binding domain-containing protein [Anaerolineales bacterium]MCB0230024.1 LysM peptidoglycan-binding domain-containing protein [Anaerolineae bacterium]MCB0239070.1 LysM peptidoglycan-binding domain-containing protein [Anaerolineae bacterium]MCB0244277.1 LysM peptidoglycan-binding domain-containing protein [Anaerolineae bacterium]
MTRRQMLAIIVINAVLSCIIATAVVLVAFNFGISKTFTAPTPYVIVASTATPAPPATSTPTALPVPSVATEVYAVQSGDTFLGIALQLGVDLDVLRALNGGVNPDRLFVGQELLVPLGSLPTATPTLTVQASPTAATTPTPTPTTTPIVVRAMLATTTSVAAPTIVEILAPGALEEEAVVLGNDTEEPLQLRNWSLASEDGRRYLLPRFTLAPGGRVAINSRLGVDDPENLFWGQTEPVWTLPTAVMLVNPAGEPVTTLTMRP